VAFVFDTNQKERNEVESNGCLVAAAAVVVAVAVSGCGGEAATGPRRFGAIGLSPCGWVSPT
jgi:hypothetical protein